jgi:uracil permease
MLTNRPEDRSNMAESRYTYDIDERPPLRHGVVYGLQWAVLMFPALIIVVNLAGGALHLDVEQKVLFLQLTLLTSGFFTCVQCLWGHRYPVLEGPATALLLTFMVLASYGPDVIQGGTILGGMLLIGLVLLGKLKRVLDFATPNVVGVILMLIAFTLLPHLTRSLIGVNDAHPGGEAPILFVSLFLVICMAAFAHWFKGFWKTVALLAGILLGSAIFLFLGRLNWQAILEAPWASMPNRYTDASPVFYWPAVAAFASAYLAVIVNSLGSLQGVAGITDSKRLPSAVRRGVLMNGIAGVFCGLLGIVGMVSYSLSPGVILANRVASRYAVAYCGGILIVAAFVPKLAALLSLAPAPVVGAALCVAMGGQVGAGMAIIMAKGLSNRDYFVVGLPVLIGTIVGYLPRDLLAALPPAVQVFLGNGLIMGIILVLLLEHLVLREAPFRIKPVNN